MNFIIEFIPKKENPNDFVFVVRAQNGYPLSVCDSLDSAKDVIQEKFDEMRASLAKQSKSDS